MHCVGWAPSRAPEPSQFVQTTAVSSLISRVVPKDQLGRVNGVQQAFRGVNVMLGPLLGAVGLDLFGLPVLLGIDLLTYVLSVAAFLFIRVDSRPEPRFLRRHFAARARHRGQTPLPRGRRTFQLSQASTGLVVKR